ncbi:MAG: cell division protein ZapE [Burkholderia sp.]|nr:cell division protein ZapE [Burkholderia sp.]
MNITEYCERELSYYGYNLDIAQREALIRLQNRQDEWLIYKSRKSNILKKFLIHPKLPRGIYIWGGVGRGKSFLMESFYMVLPLRRKIRFHFHEFMYEVHLRLKKLEGQSNPLDTLAQLIAKRYELIFLDEFNISDIADAMILYRLLDQLFINGIQFVMTSNYNPDVLYRNGLHRDRILPAISLLKENLDILNVDLGIDYRFSKMKRFSMYYTPLGIDSEHALRNVFNDLTTTVPDESPIIYIENRELRALRKTDDIIWFDFSTLCGSARSQKDYLELASRFSMIILCDVPKMSAYMESEALRFTWLIDVLYDHKVKLLMSAEVPLKNLYIYGLINHEFDRTTSRIIEMQSYKYLKMPKRIFNTSLT